MRTLQDLPDISGKRVILRCDLNVPLENGQITDDGRIRASVPTIQHLVSLGAKVIVISHLGRPEGKPESQYSLAPVSLRLGELLGKSVGFASETVGNEASNKVESMAPGDVLLLENLRFNLGETAKSDAERMAFAKQIAPTRLALPAGGSNASGSRQCSRSPVFESMTGRERNLTSQ